MFGNLLKAVVGTVIETPLSVAADIVTMGGVLTDKEQPYTVSAVQRVLENIEKAADPDE